MVTDKAAGSRPAATPAADNDNKRPLRFLSVCSGIEAASVAWNPLGWKAVAFSEIEKFPSAVLAHRYPDVPNLGDFTKIDASKLGRIDILCGGTPCQAFSVAGLRNSMGDARGNLSLEFVRLAHELSDGNGLRNVVWENVVGSLSTKDNFFGCFLAGIVGADDPLHTPDGKAWPNAGMVAGPLGRAAWRVLDAQYFGLAQRRRRVVLVADFGNGADPAAVLFERKSVHGNSPPSREAGEKPAPTISARTKGGGGLGTDFELDGGLIHAPEIARCDATREGSSQDYESTTMVAVSVTGTTSHSLTAEGADASEDGTGRGTPVIAFNTRQDQIHESECAQPLGAKDNGNGILTPAITVAIRGREGGATAELGGPIATALRASQGGGDKPHVLAALAVDCYNGAIDGDTTLTLRKGNGNELGGVPATLVHSAVRRLTPVECERLMEFPDDYTNIPWRGKPTSPDGPRYKALGNSWAVPKFAWVGARIAKFMPQESK
ncbi:DNA cytosine methyltransferase [Pseudohoeflea suaedae]|uniref:DNA (cytosine-5-)-methyltransferase n=1 Tax=Pseudohoeflea suaedae TaxID=877384 RepID=A0A4R5PKS3_9HYPH|nr:DNA cytosine methyltransferase [Pseudohoeflea suaedae]